MPDIYATNDGNINFNQGAAYGWSWDSVQANSTGTSNSSQTNNQYAVRAIQFVYLGSNRFIIMRTFMEFDTSGITEAPAEATLKIYGNGGWSGSSLADIIIVKGTQSDTLAGADYDNFDASTAYSSEFTSWNNSAYNEITLNSTALTAMADNDNFKICIMEHDYDYPDSDPGGNISKNVGMYYSEASEEYRPYIDYTEGAPAEPTAFNEIKVKNSILNIKNGSLKL